jgi:ABC-type multidrug transport system fused ATPase/permease subunit
MADSKDAVVRGDVTAAVYGAYIRGSSGVLGLALRASALAVVAIAAQLGRLLVDYWVLQWAGDSPETALSDHPEDWWINTSGLIIGATVVLLIMRTGVFLLINVDASQFLHDSTFARVMRAPMVFFDVTPLGQVMSRFSKDIDVVDTTLPDNFLAFIQQTLMLAGIIGMALGTSPYFVLPLIPLGGGLYYFQRIFRRTATQIKRMELSAFSPIFSSFAAATRGGASLRALRLQKQFITAHRAYIDLNSRVMTVYNLLQRWLAFRLDCLAALYILIVASVSVAMRDTISPSVAGLAVTYSMQMTGLLQFTVRVQIMLEGAMASVERLRQYRDVAQEPAYRTAAPALRQLEADAKAFHQANQRSRDALQRIQAGHVGADPAPTPEPASPGVPASGHSLDSVVALADSSSSPAARRVHGWPWRGHISLRGVTMGYRPELPTVLNKLSAEIPAGKKVGIVGRTGSGKSSLLLVLFRMVELRAGSVLIDGVDTASVGLGDLRSRLSIIPQSPVIFSGSLRYNLDPFSEHADADLEQALRQVDMWRAVEAMPAGLATAMAEGGANLSQGERQLLCIARALLRKNPILVLDEATAAIDLKTDALIQQSIRQAFQHCTIITIAHRLDTIVDYDYVMVLNPVTPMPGQEHEDNPTLCDSLREFDHPYKLLSNPDSGFYQMAQAAGPSGFASLYQRAKAAYMESEAA